MQKVGSGGGKRGWGRGRRPQPLLPRTALDGKGSPRGRAAGGAGRALLWARRCALRSLAALTALLLVLHLAYAGRLPAPGRLAGLAGAAASAAQLQDLVQLSGDGGPARAAAPFAAAPDLGPKLVPRILHQTYKTASVPEAVQRYMATWRALNPGWDVRFYDDHDCLDFVKREFPEYLDAYRQLDKDVERSDFFRYMVILRVGGVYADIDTECKQPLDAVIRSRDTLVVGWENEFPSAQKAVQAWYARTRQILNWAFAAAPGHPALKEVCDRIASSMRRTFSADTHLDTLERTGPGVFTDVVLKHADMHAPHQREDPWTVRILPRVQLGAPHSPAYGLSPNDPSAVIVHHALASWRIQKRWFWQWWTSEDTGSQLSRSWKWKSEEAKQQQIDKLQKIDTASALYPVSVVFEPPFHIFTHLAGHGERQSGWDVSSALTTHGSWQPSVQPSRRPSLADALVGALGIAPNAAFIDVGAGYGFFSLAAAARGHRVHAFELAPASLEAFQASIDYNGFKHLIEIHKVPLGAPQQEEYICIVPRHKGPAANTATNAAAGAAYVEMLRGYATPEAHYIAAMDCQLMAKRTPGASVVDEPAVGALRVSANGWEPFILEGFEPLLARKQAPPVVAVEWNPAAMRLAGYTHPLAMVQRLYDLGYTDISHSGFVCDERWYSITYGVRRRGGITPEDLAALKQPTWCRLLPDQFGLLVERASSTYPETLLFINRAAGQALNATATTARRGGPRGQQAAGEESGGSDSSKGGGWSSVLSFFNRRPHDNSPGGGAEQQQEVVHPLQQQEEPARPLQQQQQQQQQQVVRPLQQQQQAHQAAASGTAAEEASWAGREVAELDSVLRDPAHMRRRPLPLTAAEQQQQQQQHQG